MKDSWIEIYDTTLRDGAQGEGLAYSVEDKLKIAHALDELGVAYIEGGWPGANPKDVEFFERAKSVKLENALFAAFGSTDFQLKATKSALLSTCQLTAPATCTDDASCGDANQFCNG